jgi:hypothetical protein
VLGDVIPVIATVDDLPAAIEAAADNPDCAWYITKRAVALRATDLLPEGEPWGPLVAAYGGDWMTATRKKAVAKGEAYKSDTSAGAFPIHDKADLRRAIQAFGRAKDKAKAKAHIIRRARALKAVSLLPDSWGITAAIEAGEAHDMSAEMLRLQMDAVRAV